MKIVEDHQIARKVSSNDSLASALDSIHFSLLPQIDRLSLLPNELLDHIFDLAYSIITPSTGALSKRLLPFHITGLYRRIYLTKRESISMLIDRIKNLPDLGELVLHLLLSKASGDKVPPFETVEIDQFFSRLVRLESLDLDHDPYGVLRALVASMSSSKLPRLRHLTSSVSSDFEHPLLDFTAFPTLQSLTVIDYNSEDGAYDTATLPHLPLLTHLTVAGLYADDLSIASFCNLCPSLTHLTLECGSPVYSDLLKLLPVKLLRLDLACPSLGTDDLCERHLSRFTHLQHLVLDAGMFTTNLSSHLINLRSLEILELGEGSISTSEMSDLFNKVPINRLKLDLTQGKIGYRLEVDENGSAGGRWVPGEGRLIAGDWVIPEFDLQGDGDFTLEGAREMLREAEEMGIEVEGSIIRAIEVMDAYHLEIANIAIYRCFRDEIFIHYSNVKEQNLHARLPLLDLNSLDSTRLKIRKIQLEEEGWFALTLEN